MKLNTVWDTSRETGQSYTDSVNDSKAKFYFAIPVFVIMNIQPDPGKLIDSCFVFFLEINKLSTVQARIPVATTKPANLLYALHVRQYVSTCPDDQVKAHSAHVKRAPS